MVESVSSERDASVAAAKISSVLQCEQHCKVLAEVILKQVSGDIVFFEIFNC